MLVCDSLKLLYAHIPKTGGAAFKGAISKVAKIRSESKYHSRIVNAEKYPDYHKVTIVRNSYEITVSRWRFYWIHTSKKAPVGKVLGGFNPFPSFNDWVQKNGSKIFYQKSFVEDKEGNKLVDQVIYHDKFKEGIEELNQILGTSIVLGDKKEHFYGDYNWRSFYDEETREIVTERCKEDIEYFGFEF